MSNQKFFTGETMDLSVASTESLTRLTAYVSKPERGEPVKGLKPEQIVAMLTFASIAFSTAPEHTTEGYKLAIAELQEKHKDGDAPILLDRLLVEDCKFIGDVASAAATLQAEEDTKELLLKWGYEGKPLEEALAAIKKSGGVNGAKGFSVASVHATTLQESPEDTAAIAFFQERGVTNKVTKIEGVDVTIEGGETPAAPATPAAPENASVNAPPAAPANPISEVAGELVDSRNVPDPSVLVALVELYSLSLNEQKAQAVENISFGTVLAQVGAQMEKNGRTRLEVVEKQLTVFASLKNQLLSPKANAPLAVEAPTA